MQNRTAEFVAAVESLQTRSSGAMSASHLLNRLQQQQQLLNNNQNNYKENNSNRNGGRRMEFSQAALTCGRELNVSFQRLDKLSKRIHFHFY